MTALAVALRDDRLSLVELLPLIRAAAAESDDEPTTSEPTP